MGPARLAPSSCARARGTPGVRGGGGHPAADLSRQGPHRRGAAAAAGPPPGGLRDVYRSRAHRCEHIIGSTVSSWASTSRSRSRPIEGLLAPPRPWSRPPDAELTAKAGPPPARRGGRAARAGCGTRPAGTRCGVGALPQRHPAIPDHGKTDRRTRDDREDPTRLVRSDRTALPAPARRQPNGSGILLRRRGP